MAQYNLFNSDDVRVGLLIFSNMERAWRNTTCLIPISLTLWRMLSWSQTNALEPFQLN